MQSHLCACSSGQRIGLQGVCVWCTKPPPAHARAPGTPPRAAMRVVVTTIAIDMCIRWGRRSQKVLYRYGVAQLTSDATVYVKLGPNIVANMYHGS